MARREGSAPTSSDHFVRIDLLSQTIAPTLWSVDFLERFAVLAPYLVATLVSLIVAAILWRGRKALAGRGHFAVLMLAVALWAFFNFLEDGSDTLAAKFVYSSLQYLFIGAVPVLFFEFTLRTTLDPVPRRWAARWFRVGLWVVPLSVAVLVWFDRDYGLVRQIHGLVAVGDFTALDRTRGPGFWVFTVYSYTLIFVGLVLWGRHIFRGLRSPQRTEVLPLLAVFLPWLGNMMVLAGFDPWPGHDPTTPLFAAMGFLLSSRLNSNRVFTLLPEAQEVLMQEWPAPVLVLANRRLRYFNGRAADLWTLRTAHLGEPLSAVQTWMAGLTSLSSGATTKLTDEERQQIWFVEVKRVSSRPADGVLFLFQDITGHQHEMTEQTNALQVAYLRLNTAHDAHRRTEQQIFYYSLHDSLTALANRSLLLSRLGQSIDLLRQQGGSTYALIGIDLVNFRAVNDRYGYRQGDTLIRQLALRLKECLGDIDVPARITADRFFALVNTTGDRDTVLATARQIRERLEEPINLSDTSYLPQCRVAVVLGDPQATSPESVIDEAETTLTKMKEEESLDILVFDRSWTELRKENRLLLEDLSRAFSTAQISLVYQPIVDARDGRLLGVEALIRWNHPTLGPIHPGRMIGLAESEGLIAPLGLWALREATSFLCRATASGSSLPDIYVSVNVSPKQLRDPDFCTIVLAILDHSGLDPRRLHLEITESSVVVHSELVVPHLQSLREMGVKIKLDDFGTGFSSLQSLHELPIDTLKVDRAFVEKLPMSRPIVATILELARKLNLDSIAEGVETATQWKHLQDLGCTQIQGFLFSRGLTDKEVLELMAGSGTERYLIPVESEELPEL